MTEIYLTMYVINLEERIDRWNYIQEHFDHPRIKLIRVNAIKDEKGWKGLYKTNKEILKKHIMDSSENCLIIEDDCKVDNICNFLNEFLKIKEWLDNNLDKWDIFNGGIILWNTNLDNINIPYVTKVNNSHLLELKIKWSSANFIYYNYNIINKIIEDNEFYIWDLFLNKYKTLTSFPLRVVQKPDYSNLENRNVNYEIMSDKHYRLIKNYLLRYKKI